MDLFDAASKGDYTTAKALLEAGADPNMHDDNDKVGPLHAAIINHPDNLALIELLLTYGADPTMRRADAKNSSSMELAKQFAPKAYALMCAFMPSEH